MQNYDFGIIGGGLVGSLAALLLSQQGFSVALMDPKKPTKLGKIPDLRVSAITPFSWSLLQNAGVVAKLDPAGFCKILSMNIFEEPESPLHFYASEMGRDRLGVIIENEVLFKGIQDCFPDTIEHLALQCEKLEHTAQGFVLNDKVKVQFLILAQGGNASFAEQLNIPIEILDYQEEALVFHVESALPHGQTAYQRFQKKPLAFLPLYQNNWSSIVWTLSREDAKRFKSFSPSVLAKKLEHVFPLLGPLKIISDVASFPLYAQRALVVAGDRFVLMGDAAHIVHPLAGQGVNLGFRDVAAFCEVIKKIKARGQTLAEPRIKDDYTRAISRYNRRMSQGFSLIHIFYELAPLAALRQIGAKYLSRVEPLKKELMKFAMGERFTP